MISYSIGLKKRFIHSECGSYAAFIKSSYRNNNLVTCLLNDSFSTLHLQVIWFSMDWTFNFGLVCLDGCTVFISSCNGTLICLSLVTLIHHLARYRKITIHLKNVYLRQIVRDIRLHPPLLMELEYRRSNMTTTVHLKKYYHSTYVWRLQLHCYGRTTVTKYYIKINNIRNNN